MRSIKQSSKYAEAAREDEFRLLVARLATDLINLPADQFDAGIERALLLCGEFAGADRSYLFQPLDGSPFWSNTHEWVAEGIAREAPNLQRIPMAETCPYFWARLHRAREAVIVTDAAALPPEAAIERRDMERQGIRSLLLVPMLNDGRLSGFVGFDSVHSRRSWSNAEIALLTLTAEMLAGVLARRRTEEALRESRAGLVEAQRLARLGSWSLDLVTNTLTWSDEIFRIFEIDRAKFGASYEAFLAAIHPDDREMVNRAYTESVKNRSPYDIEHRLLMPDGRLKVVHEHCETRYDDAGRPLRSIGTVQDVTGQFEIERRLRASESRLRAIVDAEPECVKIVDDKGRVVEMNAAGLAMIEADSLDQVRGAEAACLVVPEQRETWCAFVQSVLRGERGTLECEVTGLKGARRWIETHAVPLRDEASGQTLMLAVTRDITHHKETQERLSYLANFDTLTGLPNRRLFTDRLEQAMIEADRHERLVGVVFLDLDRFKNINDTLGHDAGDEILKAVAERLTGAVRRGDTVARLSGDEFTLVLADMGHIDDAARVAQKIIEIFSTPFRVAGRELHITASVGITIYPFDVRDVSSLLRNADTAMYRAKESGFNSVRFYSADMTVKAADNLTLENELRAGIEREELVLHYQPLVDCRTGAITAVEALVRWRHPRHGLLSPDKFIPLAEETGLIRPLGDWVLYEACTQVRRWQLMTGCGLRAGVNFSADQLRGRDAAGVIRRVLKETGLPPDSLDLEITESLLLDRDDETLGVLNGLHDLGVALTIDDFGTGYSSLAYLKRYPIAALKVDRSFIRDVGHDPDDAAITQAIIGVARALGLHVVAEGVETLEQLGFLRKFGCDTAQGFYFSRPVPAAELERMLLTGHTLAGNDGKCR
jgi:diguanylate cyclase (GGDEF)-like protein/PAS domain S-box-containing protein